MPRAESRARRRNAPHRSARSLAKVGANGNFSSFSAVFPRPVADPEGFGEACKPRLCDCLAQVRHQPLVETEIMLGHQHRAQYLAGPDEMVEIGARPGRADGTAAIGVERTLVLAEAGV